MSLDPAEIPHSRRYSGDTPLLIALTGLQANSSNYNRPGTEFLPNAFTWALRMECLDIGNV